MYRAARRKRRQQEDRYARKPGAAGLPPGLRWVVLVLVLAVLGLVTASLLVSLISAEDPATPGGLPLGEAASGYSGLPELPQVPAVQHDPATVPPAPVPESAPGEAEEPRGGWPSFSFTEAERAELDTLLADWAASLPPTVQQRQDEAAAAGVDPASDEYPAAGQRVSVYFRDLHSGAEYIYAGDEVYEIASLSKAPYAMWLYGLVEEGKASLEESFTVDAEVVEQSRENSGVIKNGEQFPVEYTLEELVYYLLRHSDTVAQRVLLTRYPAADYAAAAAEWGLAEPGRVRNVTGGKVTAGDAGVYLAALQNYMQTGEHGARLREHLLNTSYPMIRSQYPVAHKYGWDAAAYHDMAVVEAPHPYLLAILSDKSAGAPEDLAMYSTLAARFEQIMAGRWNDAELTDGNTRRWQ